MGLRIPHKVDLGLSVIHIKQVNVKQMRELAEIDEDGVTPDGLWDPEEDTVYLLSHMPNQKKRRVFFHELKHAINDNDYWDLAD